MTGPGVLVAAGGAAWESAVLRELAAADGPRLVRRCVDVAELVAVASTQAAQAAVVDADLSGLDAEVVDRLGRAGVRVIGLGDSARCAALDLVVVPGPEAVLGALALAGAPVPDGEDAAGPGEGPVGRLVAVWGPTGAPGRSTVALALAAESARAGHRTVLVDADTYGGAQAQLIGVLDDVSGLMAACRAANRGLAEEVLEHLVPVGERLTLLTGLPRADMWPHVRRSALERVLTVLAEHHDVVVVDCGFGLDGGAGGTGPPRDQVTLHVLERADTVLAVGRADPVGLARLVRGIHDLAECGVDTPTVVLNQVRRSVGYDARELSATLRDLAGVEPAALLPSDVPALDAAVMRGALPPEGSPFVGALRRLAEGVLAP